MNPNIPSPKEQRREMLQAALKINSRDQQLPAPRNPGANTQPDNPMALTALHSGLMSSQPQPVSLQTMMQMQALQHLQQQNRFGIASLGLLQNPGLYLPLIPPQNAVPFLPGLPSLQVVPDPPSTLQEAIVPTNIFTRADEDVLVRALYERKGTNIGETITSLNGVNGHSRSLWGSFYLENSAKVQRKVKELEHGQSMPRQALRPSDTSSRTTRSSKNTPRQTRGNIGSHGESYQKKKYSQAFSRPKSRSPTPPTNPVSKSPRSYRYTKEDVEYFKKFAIHTLKYEPHALDNFKSFSTELAKRAKHHPQSSWNSWMYDNKGLVDSFKRKILGGEDSPSDSESGSGSDCDSHDQNEDGDDDDGDDTPLEVDRHDISPSSRMSENEVDPQPASTRKLTRTTVRTFYNPEDLQALCEHIATVSLAQWDTRKDWVEFQKKHTRHSVTSWQKFYKTYRENIRRIAGLFCDAEREADRNIEVTQNSSRPNPPTPSSSRSHASSGINGLASEKRVHGEDDDAEYEPPRFAKRSKRTTESSILSE